MSFQLPESIVDSLLAKLGMDDAFRLEFSADPRAALASLGFAPAADCSIDQGIWACMSVTHLASKQAIVSGHASIKKQLLSERATFNPISLGVRLADEKSAA